MKTIWQVEIERAANSYKAEAAQRRKLSAHDQAADALEWVARDLVERARVLGDPTSLRTVEEYAAEHGVSAQTVRNWIRAGELEARPNGRSWLIPAASLRHERGSDAAA